MKKSIYISLLCSFSVLFTSCNDWLGEETPGVSKLENFFTTGMAAVQTTNAAYVPLEWEYNTTYFSEWFIGDIVSDDALKGGQGKSDMADVYDMENFKTNTNNGLLLDFYRAQYQGIGRCNLGLREIGQMALDTTLNIRLKNRLIGELKFLRAMYYFRLVRVFGGVPKVDFVIDSSSAWKQPRASKDDIYNFIIEDLKDANSKLWLKSEYKEEEMGRATKGAAEAMLMKTYLYMHQYGNAKEWGDSIIVRHSGEYLLCDKYADNFTLAGENGPESVFEIQYMEDPTSDYGEGNGFTRGTFTVILTRSRSSNLGGGWGFNKPTQDLYDEFETGDPRLNETILNPTDAQIVTPSEEIYLGNRYINKKYGLYNADGSYYKLTHNSRGPINNKVIRYADVLLMYAEACCETGDLGAAKSALEEVRSRARKNSNDLSVLPEFPYGSYSDTPEDLKAAIRHERRVELAMEGHRWFDLCRWGIAGETMNEYKRYETDEAKAEMAEFIPGKHELFPIPADEIALNPMAQNPGY